MAILTVYTKLLDKTLSGARIIDMGSTRTCQLYVIPREKISQVAKEELLHQYCFYILLGKTEDGNPKAYIGQSNDFHRRVKDHQSKKEFWDTALVFVSKANEIYASEVLFLEYLGITKAAEINNYSIEENKQLPQRPSISPDKENEMVLFFEDIEFLSEFYGCNIFCRAEDPSDTDELPNNLVNENSHTFVLTVPKRGIDARLRFYPISNTYVILKGSTISVEEKYSCPKNISDFRKTNIAQKNKLTKKGDVFELLQDVVFPADKKMHSPSAAASFCTATSMQGTTSWKDANGATFISVFPKEY